MKTIKSALLGTKSLIDTNEDVLLVQLKEILKQHRELIISRLLGDLITYLDYKFSVKPTKEMLEKVEDELLSFKKSGIGLEYYHATVMQVKNRAVTHLTNEPFYAEIDERLKYIVEHCKARVA